MIQITKEQAEFLREKCPGINIVKTCRGRHSANRGKRYVENSAKVRSFLHAFSRDYDGKVYYDSRTQSAGNRA